MSNPAAFWPEALPYARQASAATGVLTSVILAQWAGETGFGGPDWSVYHNPGNVGNPAHAGQTNFDTIEEGVQAYIQTMKLGYYTAVRSAEGTTAQSVALGRSPWAATHYNAVAYFNGLRGDALLANAGTDLIKIIAVYDLTQYDAAGPLPAPVPTTVPPQPNPTEPTKEQLMQAVLVNGVVKVYAASPAGHLLEFTNTLAGWSVDDVTLEIEKKNPGIPLFVVQP